MAWCSISLYKKEVKLLAKIKLRKRGDTYKPAKLKTSIRKAGASSKVANEVMKKVKVRSGMTTLALRKQVTKLLRKLAPKAAKKYSKYKKKR